MVTIWWERIYCPFWNFIVLWQFTFPFTKTVLWKRSVASLYFDADWSAEQSIIMILVVIFMNSYHLDLNLKLTTQSIFRKGYYYYYMYKNNFRLLQEMFRHKRKKVVGICNEKITMFYLKNWVQKKSTCIHSSILIATPLSFKIYLEAMLQYSITWKLSSSHRW